MNKLIIAVVLLWCISIHSLATAESKQFLLNSAKDFNEERVFKIYNYGYVHEPKLLAFEDNCVLKGDFYECKDNVGLKCKYPKNSIWDYETKGKGGFIAEITQKELKRNWNKYLVDGYSTSATPTPAPWNAGKSKLDPNRPSTFPKEAREYICREAVKNAMDYYYLNPSAFRNVPNYVPNWHEEYEKCLRR